MVWDLLGGTKNQSHEGIYMLKVVNTQYHITAKIGEIFVVLINWYQSHCLNLVEWVKSLNFKQISLKKLVNLICTLLGSLIVSPTFIRASIIHVCAHALDIDSEGKQGKLFISMRPFLWYQKSTIDEGCVVLMNCDIKFNVLWKC